MRMTMTLTSLCSLNTLEIRNEPEKRHPHAAVGRRPLVQGRCTCPSCRKSPSRSPSFPVRTGHSQRAETETKDKAQNTNKAPAACSHLSVYVSVSVDVVKVKRPLQLFPQRSPQQSRQPQYEVLSKTQQEAVMG